MNHCMRWVVICIAQCDEMVLKTGLIINKFYCFFTILFLSCNRRRVFFGEHVTQYWKQLGIQ